VSLNKDTKERLEQKAGLGECRKKEMWEMVREIFRCDILAVHVGFDIYVAISYVMT